LAAPTAPQPRGYEQSGGYEQQRDERRQQSDQRYQQLHGEKRKESWLSEIFD